MFKRYAALVALAVSVTVAAPYAQKAAPPPKVTRAEGPVRLRGRRRLPPRQLHAVHRLPEEAAGAVGTHDRDRHRQDRGRADRVHRDHHLAGEPAEAAADQGGEPPAGARREPDRRAGARARARRQDRGLDRRRPARDRSARRAAADRDDLPPEHASPIRKRCASSTTSSSSARWSTRTAWSWCRTGTCARRTRSSGRPTAFRGSTRSTSATTTTATST